MLKKRYEILKGYQNNHVTIGFGSYGQVKLAKDIQTGDIVAVKIINKIAKKQVFFHHKLSHQKIIQLLDFYIDKDLQTTYMILQYAEGGTLFEKLKSQIISKNEIKKYMKDICQAVSYLHSKQIMHRDIKPQNILLTKNNTAKLCDFGFAAILGQRKTLCGTYEYMSPQMIQSKSYDYKIDIWSIGILLFQLIIGKAPFRGDTPDQVLNQMKTKIYFNQRFETIEINLIRSILRVTPQKRPNIFEILQSNYFNIQKSTITTNRTAQTKYNQNPIKSKIIFQNNFQQQQKINPLKMTFSKPPQNSYPFYIPKNTPKQYQNVINILQRQKQIKSFKNNNQCDLLSSTFTSNYYKGKLPSNIIKKDQSFTKLNLKNRFS